MEDFTIQFDYTIILALISLLAVSGVIILIKVIYRHDPHKHEQYGDEIVLFHREERYRKRVFIFHLIEDMNHLKNKGEIEGELELKVIAGEFSENAQEIVRHAINHQFKHIIIMVGPKVFCEDRTEIYTLLDKHEGVKYLVLPQRPSKHFMIFNKSHMYIEKPHRHNEGRGSVAIKKCNLELLEVYDNAFNKFLKYAKPLTKEEVLNQECYRE
ncbi:hypothetical protein [Methanobacterium sp. ACI-7]|uniref:hypothetical protein n=1 Tax=unclassified Methanobacterium TaxID=2627676 RepID=UPI0039C0D604